MAITYNGILVNIGLPCERGLDTHGRCYRQHWIYHLKTKNGNCRQTNLQCVLPLSLIHFEIKNITLKNQWKSACHVFMRKTRQTGKQTQRKRVS